MSPHTRHHLGPCNPSSCATYMYNSHWGRAATGNKKSCVYACRVTSVVSDSLRPCRLLPGEGNGSPLQYSCLENPRDGGAWWAAICGVAQSRTRLERLSSSRLWPARLLCQGGGLCRQEYWSVLANTGCHTLLEHYISCCPSR